MNTVLSGTEARALVEQGAQLLDVRSAAEFAQGAAPGAKNIPVQILPVMADQLLRDRPVVVYCQAGGRSAQAQMILRGLGFAQIHNAGTLANVVNG